MKRSLQRKEQRRSSKDFRDAFDEVLIAESVLRLIAGMQIKTPRRTYYYDRIREGLPAGH